MTDAHTINPRLIHVGVDWITVTAIGGEKARYLYADGELLSREAIRLGNDIKPWSMSGFTGYKAGSVQYGARADEAIVRLSSDMAHQYWKEVFDDADNCSRLDLQATYHVATEVAQLITRHFGQAKRVSENRRRAPTVSLLSTNNGPSTLYLNRRISDTFGRVYDKGAESKLDHLRSCIRYEIELKGNEAMRWSAYLRNHHSSDLAAGRIAIEWFARKGVCLGKARICC